MNETMRRLALLLPLLLLALPGCRQEETRRMPETQIQSRAKAVREAERKRWEAQQQEIREAAARAPAAEPPPPPQPPAAAPPAYLPPSADGAEVELTETPAGASPAAAPATPPAAPAPPAGATPPAGSRAAAGAAATSAGTGGQVPTGGAPARDVTAPSLPPGAAASAGRTAVSPPPAPDAAALGVTAPATSAEQAAALEQELQRKLKTFDALMRRAQENAAREAAAGGGPDGTDAGRGGLLETPPAGNGRGGTAAAATGLGNTPDQSGATRLPRPPPVRGGVQAELGGGADDDIVARQLREAAEREADPGLREKLWDEYRKYKSGL